jgi:hypothetical protein
VSTLETLEAHIAYHAGTSNNERTAAGRALSAQRTGEK